MQAKDMFDDEMYLKLLAIVTSAIKQTKISDDNFEAEFVSSSILACLLGISNAYARIHFISIPI